MFCLATGPTPHAVAQNTVSNEVFFVASVASSSDPAGAASDSYPTLLVLDCGGRLDCGCGEGTPSSSPSFICCGAAQQRQRAGTCVVVVLPHCCSRVAQGRGLQQRHNCCTTLMVLCAAKEAGAALLRLFLRVCFGGGLLALRVVAVWPCCMLGGFLCRPKPLCCSCSTPVFRPSLFGVVGVAVCLFAFCVLSFLENKGNMGQLVVFVLIQCFMLLHAKRPNPPRWPSSVRVFSPTDTDIEQVVNTAYRTNGGHVPPDNGQFSDARYAFLFKPGTYSADVPVGYYTQVMISR